MDVNLLLYLALVAFIIWIAWKAYRYSTRNNSRSSSSGSIWGDMWNGVKNIRRTSRYSYNTEKQIQLNEISQKERLQKLNLIDKKIDESLYNLKGAITNLLGKNANSIESSPNKDIPQDRENDSQIVQTIMKFTNELNEETSLELEQTEQDIKGIESEIVNLQEEVEQLKEEKIISQNIKNDVQKDKEMFASLNNIFLGIDKNFNQQEKLLKYKMDICTKERETLNKRKEAIIEIRGKIWAVADFTNRNDKKQMISSYGELVSARNHLPEIKDMQNKLFSVITEVSQSLSGLQKENENLLEKFENDSRSFEARKEEERKAKRGENVEEEEGQYVGDTHSQTINKYGREEE